MSNMQRQRPKSAYATMVGVTARPAGVAGIMGGVDQGQAAFYSKAMKGTQGTQHALRTASPYAEVAPSGWTAREPLVQSSWKVTGAGVISRGSVDNTYLPNPLANAWGKSRELARREKAKEPHRQSTDLLVVAKGFRKPAPPALSLNSVSEPYSKTIPLLHPIDPQRLEAGFVRGPNTIPGAKAPPVSPLRSRGTNANIVQPTDRHSRKLQYEQSWTATSCIPVAKAVSTMKRPSTAQPRYLSKSAGLPGGLSLIDM